MIRGSERYSRRSRPSTGLAGGRRRESSSRGRSSRPTYAERRKAQQARGRTRASRGEGRRTQRTKPIRGRMTGPDMQRSRRKPSGSLSSRRRKDRRRPSRKPGKREVHITRDKSKPMWERFGQSERSWKSMSRPQRLKVRKKKEWERRKSFLRKNPSKFRGGVMMGSTYRNGKLVGAFAGNKKDKRGRLEQFIKNKDRKFSKRKRFY